MPKTVKPKDEEKPGNENTLAGFIEDNQKLVTVLGIFVALTVFSGNLPLKVAGYVLSFLFLTGAVIIWLEIWQKFPSGRGTWRLIWFENVLTLSTLGIVAYWLIEFRTIWHEALYALIFMLLLAIFSAIMKRYNIFNSLFRTEPGKLRNLRFILGFLVILGFGILALYIAIAISPPMNNILDSIHDALQTPMP